MNCLLIGGAGFLGTNIAVSLIRSRYKVIILDRLISRREYFLGKGVKCITGDFCDPLLLENILVEESIDVVFHLAGSLTPRQDFSSIREDLDYNIIYPIQLLDVMKRINVRKFVFLSSGGTVYGNNGKERNDEQDETIPINTYGWMKLSMEKYITMAAYQNQLDYLILRVSNPYGRWQNINGSQGFIAVALGNIQKNKPVRIFGDGSVVRDFIFVEDLCSIITNIIDKGVWNETINLGSGIGHSLNEILEYLKKIIPAKFDVNYEENRNIDFPINILRIEKLMSILPDTTFTSIDRALEITWQHALTDFMD